ncbi:MAG: DUF4337 family protein [Rhizomicrobium sp.]|jgi:hypothetical protein
MVHDPALDAHESSEHAEHAAHDRDPFIANVSITIAVLAVLAAAAGSLESIEGDKAITASAEAVLRQDQATDSWTEYEADSLKRHMYTIAANGGGSRAADYKKTADDNAKKQDSIKTAAKDKENDRDNLVKESGAHERRHDWLTGSATITEIGIAISTVAIITKRRIAWLGALGLGAVGFALLGWAYLT